MIEHAVIQNTPEWETLRAGIPTASCFSEIITPAKLELSKSRYPYLNKLLAEWIQGCPMDEATTKYMADGHDREDQTVAAYELALDCEVEPCGFFTTDDGTIGASPDRIRRAIRKGIEAKSPQLPQMVGYLLGQPLDDKYRIQLYGQTWVCNFEGVDVVAWNPLVPARALVVVETHADDKNEAGKVYVDAIAKAVTDFRDELMEARILIEQRYGKIAREVKPKATTVEEDPFGITDADLAAILANVKGDK